MTETKREPRAVVTVTSREVDGVKPGKRLPVPDLERLRYLMRAGLVTCTVDGTPITDAHIVAKMEGA